MRLSEAKNLFRELTQKYFAGANVTFAKQSRVPKPQLPLVTLTTGNVKRPRDAARYLVDGITVAAYLSRLNITVDLFTHGEEVIDDENGNVIAYENTALEDMLAFADFLSSQYTIDWCHNNDVSIEIDGEAQDLTALVNDNNYEYRARLNIMFYFTQQAVGAASVFDESSIQYPTGDTDEDGDPIYTPEEPPKTDSTTGYYTPDIDKEGEVPDHIPDEVVVPKPVVIPTPEITPSGGGSEELAQEETGYFTEVEIKEEIGNE